MSSVPAVTSASLWLALEQSGSLTPTALILPADVNETELLAICQMFATIKKMTSFATGDALLYAQINHGDEAWVEIVEACAWNYHSMENVMSVCRNVRPAQRRQDLSFGHHDVVRKLLPNDQRHWLKQAHENGWTRQQLRDQIYGERVLPPAVSNDLPSVVRDAVATAREMNDGYWISRDSYQRLRAAIGEEP